MEVAEQGMEIQPGEAVVAQDTDTDIAETAPDTDIGEDDAAPGQGDVGADDEPVGITREQHEALLDQFNEMVKGSAPEQPQPPEQPETPGDIPAFFNIDGDGLNRALSDPSSFNEVMSKAMLQGMSQMLAMYEDRNKANIRDAAFSVVGVSELIKAYPQLEKRGDLAVWAFQKAMSENQGASRERIIEAAGGILESRTGLARRIDAAANVDVVPRDKQNQGGSHARGKTGARPIDQITDTAEMVQRLSRINPGGVTSERGRLGLG